MNICSRFLGLIFLRAEVSDELLLRKAIHEAFDEQ